MVPALLAMVQFAALAVVWCPPCVANDVHVVCTRRGIHECTRRFNLLGVAATHSHVPPPTPPPPPSPPTMHVNHACAWACLGAGLRIISVRDQLAMQACGDWPSGAAANDASPTTEANGTLVLGTHTEIKQGGCRAHHDTDSKAGRASGLVTGPRCHYKLPVRNGAACRGQYNEHLWWAWANGTFPLAEACCVRKYEGNKHHFTQQFPKDANRITVEEREGLRVLDRRSKAIEISNSRIKKLSLPNPFVYSGPLRAARAFAKKHGLQSGYVAVHWRSEKQNHKDRIWKDTKGWTDEALASPNLRPPAVARTTTATPLLLPPSLRAHLHLKSKTTPATTFSTATTAHVPETRSPRRLEAPSHVAPVGVARQLCGPHSRPG